MRAWTSSLVVMLATVAGTAAAQVPTTLPPAVITDTIMSSVTVDNHRKAPVTVYLATGKFDRRLGVVPPQSKGTLPLPDWAVSQGATVRLFAHAEDSFEDLSTDKFTLTNPARLAMVIRGYGEALPVAPTDTMMEKIPPEELANATVTVDNPRKVPVTVFAEAGPFAIRLGEVAANSRSTLRFPKAAINPFGSVTLFVHPQGGHDLASTKFSVKAGDHLGLRVPAN